MPEIKTKVTDADVREFIRTTVESDKKREDAFALLDLFERVTGLPPRMWGPSIIGFGKYHYRSERSTQEGDWPLVGFSPRKAAISLYVFTGNPAHEHLLDGLGKFTRGAACIYVKKMADIDLTILEKLIRFTMAYMRERYPE